MIQMSIPLLVPSEESLGHLFFLSMTNITLSPESSKAYLDYAASVIVSKTYDYEGYDVPMTRRDNGIVYVNLTEVARAFPNKNLSQIINSREIRDYCNVLAEIQNYSSADLLIVSKGGDVSKQGTWAHQKVALRVAQKLSPDFAVQVDTWIEELLTKGNVAIRPLTKSQQTLEAVKQLCEIAQQQVELEQRQLEMESEQKLLAQKVSHIEDVIKPNGFMSVMGFANIHHLNIGEKAANSIGHLASKWCKRRGIKPEKVRCSRFGGVNTYPMEALYDSFVEFYPNMSLK